MTIYSHIQMIVITSEVNEFVLQNLS